MRQTKNSEATASDILCAARMSLVYFLRSQSAVTNCDRKSSMKRTNICAQSFFKKLKLTQIRPIQWVNNLMDKKFKYEN